MNRREEKTRRQPTAPFQVGTKSQPGGEALPGQGHNIDYL